MAKTMFVTRLWDLAFRFFHFLTMRTWKISLFFGTCEDYCSDGSISNLRDLWRHYKMAVRLNLSDHDDE